MHAHPKSDGPPDLDLKRDAPLLSPAEVAAMLPSAIGAAGRVNYRSVIRWALAGHPMPDGSQLKLPHVRLGKAFAFWARGVEWWLRQLTEAKSPADVVPVKRRTRKQANRAAQKAIAEVRKLAGVKG